MSKLEYKCKINSTCFPDGSRLEYENYSAKQVKELMHKIRTDKSSNNIFSPISKN